MSQLDDAEQIAREGATLRAQLRAQMRRVLDPHAVATRLFRAPDGRLKDDAATWLHDLGQLCFADRTTYDPDPRQHAHNEGARAVFLHILASLHLDQRRLAALARELRETDDE